MARPHSTGSLCIGAKLAAILLLSDHLSGEKGMILRYVQIHLKDLCFFYSSLLAVSSVLHKEAFGVFCDSFCATSQYMY